MKRVRWFAAEWPVALRTLATKMKSNAFTEESLNGFIIERVRDTFINGRFIEKIAFQETLTTPFGEEQVIDRVLYRQLEFNLFSTYPHIELWDAPRSTQGFVTRLMELGNFAVTLVPLSVDLLSWLSRFQELAQGKVIVDSLQISGLELEKGIHARIQMNGEGDVRGALSRITKGKSFELDNVHLKLVTANDIIPIYLGSTGGVKLHDSYTEELLPILRRSIPESLE